MRVAELIRELSKQPANALVYFDNQEFGPDLLTGIEFQPELKHRDETITNAVWLLFEDYGDGG